MAQKCRIHIHSRTHRLSDCDGRSFKAVIDSLVDIGVLPDDSAEFVKEVRQTQEKYTGPEETEITLTWDENEANRTND